MKLNSLRLSARAHGINPAKLPKVELIKQIQRAEGNFDCYASATTGHCDQSDCAWRDDCLSASIEGAAGSMSTQS